MKQFKLFSIIVFIIICFPAFAKPPPAQNTIDQKALQILHHMTLKEKIGQKLMLDLPYWCSEQPKDNQPCTQAFIRMNPVVKQMISQNHIVGIILFEVNLKDITQIKALTQTLQQTMHDTNNLPLLISTDQEGGILGRLPRDSMVTFPGNMALAAAYLGQPNEAFSAKMGEMIADNLKAVGINVNFAPDVDVNINPFNPIINVRSFSDDPILVSKLGLSFSQGLQKEGVAATLKHFPGHGDTTSDSHIGLPLVNHTLEEARKIDLYPFKTIIENNPPDLIMTAHIQFPALDNSKIDAAKLGEKIITPATLSRKIQFDILRNQLHFNGVIITDALDMGAIAQNFDPIDATIKAFQAGDDIALMPVTVSELENINRLTDLISKIELMVLNGTLPEQELNKSVLRIIKLKIKLGLFNKNKSINNNNYQRELENKISEDAVTLIQNNNQVLPIKLTPKTRIHILTPWIEQGAGIAIEINRLQTINLLPKDIQVTYTKISDTNLKLEKLIINNSDILIVGNSATKSSIIKNNYISDKLNDDQFAYQALRYAKNHGKKTIFISLLAPYDLPNFKNVSDVMLAGYNYYGYIIEGNRGYYRGPMMPALTQIIFGLKKPKGKLPVNVPDPSIPTDIIYLRGFGLTI